MAWESWITTRDHPDRQVGFIFRSLLSNADTIMDTFKDYDAGPFHTDHKYARARVHSTTTSPYLDFEYREGLESVKVPCWLNLRNDDLFVLRWGDPDYVREFMANVPRDLMRWEAGYFMGPDGFVQGREFVHKDPDLSGQLEVDKHWYRFMMFGRLGYDLTLTRDFFEQKLKHRFPQADSKLLYDTWKCVLPDYSPGQPFLLPDQRFHVLTRRMYLTRRLPDSRRFLLQVRPLGRIGNPVGPGVCRRGTDRQAPSMASRPWK